MNACNHDLFDEVWRAVSLMIVAPSTTIVFPLVLYLSAAGTPTFVGICCAAVVGFAALWVSIVVPTTSFFHHRVLLGLTLAGLTVGIVAEFEVILELTHNFHYLKFEWHHLLGLALFHGPSVVGGVNLIRLGRHAWRGAGDAQDSGHVN